MQSGKTWKLTREGLVAVLSVMLGITIPTILQSFFSIPRIELSFRDIIIIIVLLALAAICLNILRAIEKRTTETTSAVETIASNFKSEIGDLIQRIEHFDYEQDFEHDWEKGKYEGRVFKKLTKLIDEADTSIDAISLSSIADSNFFQEALQDRQRYFDQIVVKVKQARDNNLNFTYRRVFQVDKGIQSIPQLMLDHHKRSEQLSGGNTKAYVKRTNRLRMTGLVIIDSKILVFVVNGITKDEKYYPVALLIFKRGAYAELIDSYSQYFVEVFNRADLMAP